MVTSVKICSLIVLASLLGANNDVAAQQINPLAQCRAQSLDIDRIHSCMDGYLDILDDDLQAITDFLGNTLAADAVAGLNSSQRAFVEYRRQNCLWYLEFSSPRIDAEQIAKNCLATMSGQRLVELQDLLSADSGSGQAIQGFYVYGAQRNSFQPCGSEQRLWVEGDAGSVGLMQQTYLSVATEDLQLLHASVTGRIDEQLQVPEGHQGVLQLSSLVAMRVPTEGDCQLPDPAYNLEITASDVDAAQDRREVADFERAEQEEPEQQLTAYFGAWLVDCIEVSSRKSCSLEVALGRNAADVASGVEEGLAQLTINRMPRRSTSVELEFAEREIDSPTLIRWQIDSEALGDIVESSILVDQDGTRQQISESPYLTDDLLPKMIRGRDLKVSVLDTVDDTSTDDVFATLEGLTKALVFADDFVSNSDLEIREDFGFSDSE